MSGCRRSRVICLIRSLVFLPLMLALCGRGNAATVSSVTFNPSTVIGHGYGGAGTTTVTVSVANPGQNGTVVYYYSSNQSIAPVPYYNYIIIGAGNSSGTFTISTQRVATVKYVTISCSCDGNPPVPNSNNSGILTIEPLTVSGVSLSPPAVLGGGPGATKSTVGTISISSPCANSITIFYYSSNVSIVPVPYYNYITIPAGATTGTFSLTAASVTSLKVLTISAAENGFGPTVAASLYVDPTNRVLTPGEPRHPSVCSVCEQSLGASIDLYTGNVMVTVPDPVATRGYPLTCNIVINSQVSETARPMGNATFTYDMHVTTQTVYDSSGNSSSHWIVADGDGKRIDFGLSSGAPTAGPGVFSLLSQQGTYFILSGAGPPGELDEAGDFAYTFMSGGQLLQISDPAGNVQTLTWSGGQLQSVTDVPTGKQITFVYTGSLITQISESGGAAITNLAFTPGGYLNSVQISAPSATLTSAAINYNSDGTIASVTRDGDPSSALSYNYTPYAARGGGTVMLANENDGSRVTSFAWGVLPGSGQHDRVSSTTAYGGVYQYDFDASGNFTSITEPVLNGATQSLTITGSYNSANLLVGFSDGTTSGTLGYTANGILSSYVDNQSNHWTASFNSADPVSSQDPVQAGLGVSDSLGYGDPQQPHIPTTFTDSLGNVWSFTHNAYGQTISVSPPVGSQIGASTTVYDENPLSSTLGYPISYSDGNGDPVTIDSYDLLGDPLSISTYPSHGNPNVKNTTLFAFDAAQRLTQVTYPDGHTSQSVFVGRHLDHTVDAAGTQFNYLYCAACGALTGMTGPLNWSLGWQYDPNHNLVAFTDPLLNITQYNRGAAGELKQVVYPDQSTLELAYSNNGLLRQLTNGRSDQIALAYDNLEHLTGVTFPTTGQTGFTFGFNSDDTIHSIADAAGTTTATYLANGAVSSVVYNYASSGLSAIQEIDYTYYPDGLPQTVTWKSAGAVIASWIYSFDPGGALATVQNNWNETTQWSHDGEGKLTGQSNSNGTSLAIGYLQARGWPNQINYTNPAGTFASYSLTYDGGLNTVGNLTGVAEGSGDTVAYSFDPLYRLQSDTRVGSAAYSNSYSLDLSGNLTTLNGSAFAQYDGANKVSGITGGTAAYDGDGDLTSISGTSVPNGVFTWNDLSDLTSQSDGISTTTYGYNASGLRVWSQAVAGAKTFYIYSGAKLLGEVSANGTPNVAYTWGLYGPVSERLIGSNTSLWYAFGPQGEARELTDSTGAVVDTYLYTAYGSPLTSTGTDSNPFRFGGQSGYYTDLSTSTGTVLCGLRWYSPAITRWLSRDPIGYDGGANLYAYCVADPVNLFDRDGTLDDRVTAVVNSLSGYFDCLTMGGTAYLRKHLTQLLPGKTNIVDEKCSDYNHGVVISTVAQLVAMGGGGILKVAAPAAVAAAPEAVATAPAVLGAAEQVAQNAAKGKKFEELARQALGVAKNAEKVDTVTMSGREIKVIHDAETATKIYEFKNVNTLSCTAQIEGEINYAHKVHKIFHLIIDSRTELTGPLKAELRNANAIVEELNQVTGQLKRVSLLP